MKPLKLAKGSVRAILAFVWTGSFIVWAFLNPDKANWQSIIGMIGLIIGFYFGTRSSDNRDENEGK
jgi:uncharacterized membrane protein YfcA